MAHTEEYQTVIKLNSDQAQKEIDKLEKKVSDLRKKQADYKPDSVKYKNLQKEIDKTTSKLGTMNNRIKSVEAALKDMSNATPKQLKATIKDINALLNSGDIKRGSEEWHRLTDALKEANTELAKIKKESKASQPIMAKFFKFLNDSWGGILILAQTISGVTMTIRKSVEDYAQMEEEMADVRKYTGLADEKVRELNEDFKKMDTRTSREQLNQLAGSAGRLGLQSTKDIKEFVEAADMIGVALGDDLGDGAVDKIGKLAMAFGEDEKKGLKGAMLSTGSALNELAQNSSAQAGYIVEYTARVAGFGKQLGLTQAQIMGYGAVMDENMLKDEMAATAFGNMLTKMQTDTEKFAKIAGMSVKDFTDLLNKDANQAILTLADNLKKADPQTMMKMLDSMGLDGSRAVGVLSTLADKIDDVRKHQARATEAYEKATSVGNEFNTMNNTVQARIDKCKKAFREMAVELGERLLPVVQHTITGASLLAKAMSIITGFVQDHWKSLFVLTGYVTALTVAWNANTISLKLSNAAETVSIALKKGHAFVVNTLRQAYIAWRIVVAAVTANHVRLNGAMVDMKRLQMTNVWTALITVVLTAAVAIYGAVKAWKSHSEAVKNSLQQVKEMRAQQELEKELNKKVNESIVEQKTKVEQLSRIIHSNAYTIDERRSAIKRMQEIVPEYHGAISKEGKLYNDNSTAIKQYIQDLSDAALAEAVYQKKVEINKKKMDLNFKQNRIENSLKAVQAYRDTQQQTTYSYVDADGRVHYTDKKTPNAVEVKTDSALKSDQQEKIHKQRLDNVKSEQKVVEAEEKYIDKVLEKNKKVNELLNKKVTSSTTTNFSSDTTAPTGDFVSDEEKKKLDAERHKQEIEERNRLKEAEDAAKAAADANIAAKTHEYAMGKIAYHQYIQDIAKLQQEGLRNRRDVYQEGTAEYEKLNRQLEELSFKGDQKVNQMKLEDLQRSMLRQQAEIEAQAAREEITEVEKQERLRMLNESFLADKVELYKEGSKERLDAEWELEQTEQRNKTEREKEYQQQLDYIRQEYLGMSNDRQLQIALDGLKRIHQLGLISEEEYQRAIIAIRAQYANAQTPAEHTQGVANDMLTNARNAAAPTESSMPIVGTIQNYKTLMEKLQDMYGKDEKNHEAYLMAKQQATAQFCESLASEIQAAYSSVNQVMQAASSLFSAQQEYETAMVQKKYEKQIAAAGNNQKKVKKLQEQQQKEEAAIKTKYNRKQVKIQIAQAIAQTAVNALNAYGSAAAVPVIGHILAPIAAAMATAAGMIQVAAIQKQAQAQEAGYYEGGFTGGRRYRKEAGVVHEGEFVANHQAVNNPNVLPFLNFLDQAQRNNTVGSLTAEDVSRSMGAGTSQLLAPIVNVNVDNERLNDSIDRINENQDRLASQLEQGIGVDIPIDGENGLYRRIKRYEDLLKKK